MIISLPGRMTRAHGRLALFLLSTQKKAPFQPSAVTQGLVANAGWQAASRGNRFQVQNRHFLELISVPSFSLPQQGSLLREWRHKTEASLSLLSLSTWLLGLSGQAP